MRFRPERGGAATRKLYFAPVAKHHRVCKAHPTIGSLQPTGCTCFHPEELANSQLEGKFEGLARKWRRPGAYSAAEFEAAMLAPPLPIRWRGTKGVAKVF